MGAFSGIDCLCINYTIMLGESSYFNSYSSNGSNAFECYTPGGHEAKRHSDLCEVELVMVRDHSFKKKINMNQEVD